MRGLDYKQYLKRAKRVGQDYREMLKLVPEVVEETEEQATATKDGSNSQYQSHASPYNLDKDLEVIKARLLAVDAIRGVPLGQERMEMYDQVYEESL
jgi:hypothetical protein